MNRQKNLTAIKNQNPIGIFDSGLGGLCILNTVRKHLPFESFIYFADSANCPYGSKTAEEVLSLSQKTIEFLLECDCKLIVIACNTITAVAIELFRSKYPVPFIGMEPAIKPATLQSTTGRIGVLATENTFNGNLFKRTFEQYAKGLDVCVVPGHGLVELVERGAMNSEKARLLLEKYLAPMLEKGVDTLVLGCTHYPFLKDMIASITKNRMVIIDPSDAVAAQTQRILKEFDLNSPKGQTPDQLPKFRFFTTGSHKTAESLCSRIMEENFVFRKLSL